MDFDFDYYQDSNDDAVEEDEDYYSDIVEEEENKEVIDYSLLQSHFDKADMPSGVEASLPSLINLPSNPSPNPDSGFDAGQSSSVVNSIDTLLEFVHFRRFDTVDSFSDHHYATKSGLKGNKAWAKRINKEWSSLSTDLPETIFVRVAEDRIDLLRAAMVGPAGTPYYGGLFFFDCYFPPQYPHKPPSVHYHSGGLRINPNLYDCGRVCLSLLGTWPGQQTENWVAGESTMLQVLVSIQALVLNEKPFFNEPEYEKRFVKMEGVRMSNTYNEGVFTLSLKTMVYSMRNPPHHFADLVMWHFQRTGKEILVACKAYGDGAYLDSVDQKFKLFEDPDEQKGEDEDKKEKVGYKSEPSFRKEVKGIMNLLVACFSRVGTQDIDEFRYCPNSDILIQDTNNT